MDEIWALGDLKASDYIELLIEQLLTVNVRFDQSFIYAITAYSIGKIGAISIPQLVKFQIDSEELEIAIMDCYGEIKSKKASPYIKRMLLRPYSQAMDYVASVLVN